MAIGHSPSQGLSPQDEALFRAFQSNLLSLISHELRTPLTGILNALGLLEEGPGDSGFTQADLITMARQNAHRLHRALVTLLDLAALESGTFHARLREVDLTKLVQGRVGAQATLFKDRSLKVSVGEVPSAITVLADPKKLGRALELAFQALVPRAEEGSAIQIRISSSGVEVSFQLATASIGPWESAWSEALAGYQGGVTSPSSAFAGVLQSEQAFLTRMEEGLGSELLLIHEIMRLHGGKCIAKQSGRNVKLTIELSSLSPEDAVRAVLTSRAYDVSTELKSVALILLRIPKGADASAFSEEIRKSLFRNSDAIYNLPRRGEVAVVLDDCKVEDAPNLVVRIHAALGKRIPSGIAHCPGDGLDPSKLFELADSRLSEHLE